MSADVVPTKASTLLCANSGRSGVGQSFTFRPNQRTSALSVEADQTLTSQECHDLTFAYGRFPLSTPAFKSHFRLLRFISGGPEVVGTLLGRELVQQLANGLPKRLLGAGCCLAQQCLKLGEGILNRVEVGRVRRQTSQRGASGLH